MKIADTLTKGERGSVDPGATVEEKNRVKRHRITIQEKVMQYQDEFGAPIYEWVKVCETWAEIHDGMITIRYQKHLFPRMRVKAGEDRFEITAVIDRPGKTRLVELHVSKIPSASGPTWRASAMNSNSTEGFR